MAIFLRLMEFLNSKPINLANDDFLFICSKIFLKKISPNFVFKTKKGDCKLIVMNCLFV